MNSTQLNNALLEILLHIGTSFDFKAATSEAMSSYLRQLDLSGAILFEKQNKAYVIQMAKPKILKNDVKPREIIDAINKDLPTMKERYFNKALPFVVSEGKNFYYVYALDGFGMLMLIRNFKALGSDAIKALRPINEKFTNALISCQNIEKLRTQDKQLLEQSRMAQMGELISMIAHQWRQPLGTIASTVINIQAKMMMGKFDFQTKEGADECQNFLMEKLENIDTYVQSLSTTIDDFRNFYNPHKKQSEVTINEPIQKSLSIIKSSMASQGIEVIEKFEAVGTIKILDGEMMQVFLNILKNAQDNFKEREQKDAKIFINTMNIEGGVKIEFIDNGGGIPDDIMMKVFDPYFSTKNEKNGTGLGLYMSKTIVEEHHKGRLEVENREDGVCFSITLYQ